MTVALSVLLAVAVVAAVATGWAAHRRGTALRRDEVRRAGEAETRIGEALRRAEEAERRAHDAERRAEESGRRGGESGPTRADWDLERLRVEREWTDVVGPGVPLPVPWDGSVGAVVAIELSVIREVMGTPSELSMPAPLHPCASPAAAVTARISTEMLRILARSGEEMQVVVTDEAVTVVQPAAPGEEPPDLGALAGAARAAGLDLAFGTSAGRTEARLTLA